jgi:hypothetical protein
LFSCESEKDPCDIEYQLNEPGGFGRNEVTFLINGETVWHSSRIETGGGSSFGGSVSGGGSKFSISRLVKIDNSGNFVKDSLGNYIYSDFYRLFLQTRNSSECDKNIFNNYQIRMRLDGFNDESNVTFENEISVFSQMLNSDKYYDENKNDPLNVKVFLNRQDSIVYGTFEGNLYGKKEINGRYVYDTIRITNGVFDYRYKAHNFHGEIK